MQICYDKRTRLQKKIIAPFLLHLDCKMADLTLCKMVLDKTVVENKVR